MKTFKLLYNITGTLLWKKTQEVHTKTLMNIISGTFSHMYLIYTICNIKIILIIKIFIFIIIDVSVL